VGVRCPVLSQSWALQSTESLWIEGFRNPRTQFVYAYGFPYLGDGGGGAESPTLSREQRSIPNLKGD